MGTVRLHSSRWSTKSSRPGVGVVVVLEDEHHRRRGGEPLEERPPGPEQLVRAPAGLDAQQGQEGRLDPAALVGVGHVLGDGGGDLGTGRGFVVCLQQAGATTDHLAESPERDALAVGRAAALVPPHGLDQAVDVLEELPSQPRLADPGRADDAHEACPALARRGVEEVLEQAEFVVAAHERGLERVRTVAAADLGDHPKGPPGGDRTGLALERLLTGRLERDGLAGRALGSLTHEHGPGAARPTGGGSPY